MSVAQELVLRPHQVTAVNGVHELMRQGKKRIVLVAPTGSGKRYLIVWWGKRAADGRREALIVTDRKILVDQASAELHNFVVEHGIIMGGHDENRLPFVQLASIQSLDRRYLQRDPAELPGAKVILVDEGHKEPDRYAKLFSLYPDAFVILFTATPVGPQGRSLVVDNLADALYEPVKNSTLIKQGWLLPTTVYAPSEPNIEGVKIKKAGEYPQDKLGQKALSVTLFGDVFAEWAPFADRKTIVFAPGVAYCYGLKGGPGITGDSFYARGIESDVIEAGTPQKEREAILERFRFGDLRILISVDVLKEGFDAPEASCAIDLQPNAQLRSYWQKVGRIKRPHPGQEFAVYIDMAGNYWRFPHPDDDPAWDELTSGQTTQEIIERRRQVGQEAQPVMCPKCSFVRKGGPVCPECGHRCDHPVRRVRMGKGKLREVSAEMKQKKEKTAEQRERDKWKSTLFRGLRGNRTLAQCRWLYKRTYGEWPANTLPCMPEFGSAKWTMRVDQVYQAKDIMKEFELANHREDAP